MQSNPPPLYLKNNKFFFKFLRLRVHLPCRVRIDPRVAGLGPPIEAKNNGKTPSSPYLKKNREGEGLSAPHAKHGITPFQVSLGKSQNKVASDTSDFYLKLIHWNIT